MSQCEALSELGNIRCVMEAGHEPVGTFHGVALQHNFGGTGPYSPPVTRPPAYPAPRSREEINKALEALIKPDRGPLLALRDAVLALLPSHGHSTDGGQEVQWTTPAGLWNLRQGYLRDGEFQYWDTPLYTLMGPFGQWTIRDPDLQHIRAVLIITGAIEEAANA